MDKAISALKNYCVVYLVCGTPYRYRCQAKTARAAKKMCSEYMGVELRYVVEAYLEV